MKFHAKQIQAIRWPEARRHECHVWEAVVVTKALVTLLMPMPQVFRKAEGGHRKQRRILRLIGGGDAVVRLSVQWQFSNEWLCRCT